MSLSKEAGERECKQCGKMKERLHKSGYCSGTCKEVARKTA